MESELSASNREVSIAFLWEIPLFTNVNAVLYAKACMTLPARIALLCPHTYHRVGIFRLVISPSCISSCINEKLWIGHFDITSKNGIPAFRHTILVSQKNEFLYSQLEELVDIAIYECEKYYPAFHLILFEENQPQEALKLCLFEPAGNA